MTSQTPTADTASPPTSTMQVLLHTPLYRGAMLGLFISGLGGAAATPQIARFLVDELGASLSTAGIFYLTSLTAPIAGYLIGSRSDRTGNRLGFFRICALAGFIGWLLFAFSTHLWVPFVLSATVLAFAGASTSQLFAAIHDDVAANPTPNGDGVIAFVRMSLTAAWIVGPVFGTMIAANTSPRTVLLFTAMCALAQIVPLGTVKLPPAVPRVTRTIVAGQAPVSARVGRHDMMPLLIFTGLCLAINAGEAVKHAYLPIYMADHLHLSPAMQGITIGIQPLVEFPLIPVAVILAKRIGSMRLIGIAAIVAVIGNLLFAVSSSALEVLLAQALMGVVWGVFAAMGVIVAQRLLPMAVATASGVFMSSGAIGSALGGFTGGIGVAVLGLPVVFILPAVFCVVTAVGMFMLDRRTEVRV